MNMHESGEGKHSKQLYLIKLLAGFIMEAVLCFSPFKTAVKLPRQGSYTPECVNHFLGSTFPM